MKRGCAHSCLLELVLLLLVIDNASSHVSGHGNCEQGIMVIVSLCDIIVLLNAK